MKRVLLAGLAGGLTYFAWGNVVWMVLPFYGQAIDALPDEEKALVALREAVPDSGTYMFPAYPDDMNDESAMQVFKQRHRTGPIGFLVMSAEGKPVMPLSMFARGFLLNLLGAFILAYLLSRATALQGYGDRVAFVVMIGVFTSIAGPLMAWNWMYYPTDWVMAAVIDYVVGALLLGLVLAALIKPEPTAPSK